MSGADVPPGTGAEPHGFPLDELLRIARMAADGAATLITDRRPEHLGVTQKSTETDHVTEMDTAAERLIREVLAQHRPADAVLGEEFGGEISPDGVTWIVDPIDGTTNYLYDHPGYAVSVAAWNGAIPLVGVVADPTHRRTYHARLGGGAWCSDPQDPAGPVRRLSLGKPRPLPQMLIATGFGYEPARRAVQGRVVAELLPQVRDIRRMGAAALDMCSVAAGRVDAYYEAGLSVWDLAAGRLIASEAGATVEAIEGGEVRPGSVLVCHPERVGELRALLHRCGVSPIDV
ncbi:MAG: inositol monophosphatase family protein [Microthrixaceae bacterium]